MIHHVSFSAKDPGRMSAVLAELLGGTALAAPSPPFPAGSRFVCRFDERGSMIEIAPWGVTFEPGAREETTFVPDAGMRERSSFHALLAAALPAERILAIAAREGWRAAMVDNGPFSVVNLWLENRQLVELATPDMLAPYVGVFGPANRDHLDGQLRELERMLRAGAPGGPGATSA